MTIRIEIEALTGEQARLEIFALAGIHIPQEIPGTLLNGDLPSITLPAEFGAPLQGGVYVGPHWEDSKLVHLIAATEDLGEKEWDDAQKAASEYRGGGHDDWFLPAREQLEIARIYAQGSFEKAWHWSATPYGSGFAWAVDFANGGVCYWDRSHEFRVRPFRRFIA